MNKDNKRTGFNKEYVIILIFVIILSKYEISGNMVNADGEKTLEEIIIVKELIKTLYGKTLTIEGDENTLVIINKINIELEKLETATAYYRSGKYDESLMVLNGVQNNLFDYVEELNSIMIDQRIIYTTEYNRTIILKTVETLAIIIISVLLWKIISDKYMKNIENTVLELK